MDKDKANQLKQELRQFTGTSQYYHHPMFKTLNYTDGVRFIAQKAGAYWLLEHILIHQTLPEIAKEEFQVWKIKVVDSKATITVDDGNDNIVKTFHISYTDFPLDEFAMWVENGVLYLPSER